MTAETVTPVHREMENSPGIGKPAAAPKIIVVGSPFVRTGSILMENQALRINYDSFGKSHTAFIEPQNLNLLVRDRFAPAAPVRQIRMGVDGAEITEKIGYATRTVSGKALKISTSTSGGDLVVSWTSFLHVVNRKVRSVTISRIRNSALEAPGAAFPFPGRSIREGLAGGF